VIRLKDFYEDLIRERTEAARKEVDAILGKRDADLDELNAKRDKEIFDMIEKQIHNFN
jgi:vacuolar-type H+-ATPase subunit H